MTFQRKLIVVAAIGHLLGFSILLWSQTNLSTTDAAFWRFARTSFGAQEHDWEEHDALYNMEDGIEAQLLPGKRALVELVKQAQETSPKNSAQALSNFYVFARAGMYEESRRSIHDLKRLWQHPDHHILESIFDACLRHFEKPDLAVEVADAFTESFDQRDYCYDMHDPDSGWSLGFLEFVETFLNELVQSGWTAERVDKWLSKKSGRLWTTSRLRFNKKHGNEKECRRHLEADIRRNPRDTRKAINFLRAVGQDEASGLDTQQFGWMCDVIHPRLATEALEIAELLAGMESIRSQDDVVHLPEPSLAARFYRIAIRTDLSNREILLLRFQSQGGGAEKVSDVRSRFSARVRERLAEHLAIYDEDSPEARQLVLEAKSIAKKDDVYYPGSSTPEEAALKLAAEEWKLLAEEPFRKADPAYWLDRNRHYSHRKDIANALYACEQGLLVAPAIPATRGKGTYDLRRVLLANHVKLLMQLNRRLEASELLWRELSESPPDADSSIGAAGALTEFFQKQVTVKREELWKWLESKPHWGDFDRDVDAIEHVLFLMFENLDRGEWEESLQRAEQMAMGSHPTRTLVLGKVVVQLKLPERAVPLLEHAAMTGDGRTKQEALHALVQLHQKSGDKRREGRAINEILARGLYQFEGCTGLLIRAAVISGESEDHEAAMRYWRQVANLDLTDIAPIEQLVKAGLKSELISFYEEIQTSFPTSEVPPKVLASLRRTAQ